MGDDVFALTGLAARHGAAPDAVSAAERDLRVRLPDEYREFLLRSNGLEGFAGPEAYLMLYRAEEIAGLQALREFFPRLTVIGSDGGGEAYGFLTQEDGSVMYVRVPIICGDDETMDRISPTFLGFVKRLHAGDFP